MIGAERILAALETARRKQASDVHIEPGEGAAIRVFTRIERLPGPIAGGDVESFVELSVDARSRARLERVHTRARARAMWARGGLKETAPDAPCTRGRLWAN